LLKNEAGDQECWLILNMDSTKTIKLLFFANLRDRAGINSIDLEIPDKMTVSELKEKIAREYPGLQPLMESVVIAINREFAFDDFNVPDRAEVALFPPVSGG
jgi:molybdopterin converting factor subunit 1